MSVKIPKKYKKFKVGKYTIHIRPLSPKIVFKLNKMGYKIGGFITMEQLDEDLIKAMIRECIYEKDEKWIDDVLDAIMDDFKVFNKVLDIVMSDLEVREADIEKFRTG